MPAPQTIEAMLDYARESFDLVAPAVCRKVNPAVVVIRANGQDVEGSVPPGSEFTTTGLRIGRVIELEGRHP